MSEQRIDPTADAATSADGGDQESQGLSGPGAGLGATETTADQFHPGDNDTANTYGDPGGTGAGNEETTEGARNVTDTLAQNADNAEK